MYNCSMQLKLKHTNFIILANGTSTNYTFPVYKYSITFTLTIKSKIIYKDVTKSFLNSYLYWDNLYHQQFHNMKII